MHHASTPLHLAFSCYVLDESGRLLVTRRALSKATFPGVWTNTCCGHPAPGEAIEDAVVRRVGQELGITLHDLRLVLPDIDDDRATGCAGSRTGWVRGGCRPPPSWCSGPARRWCCSAPTWRRGPRSPASSSWRRWASSSCVVAAASPFVAAVGIALMDVVLLVVTL